MLGGGVILGLTTVGRVQLREGPWLTAFFACYGVIVFAAQNGILALGFSAGLGVLWIVTGHDRELVRAEGWDAGARLAPHVDGRRPLK